MIDTTRGHITMLLSGDDPDERRHAAEALARCTDLAPIAALAAALRDPNKGVRDAATRSLFAIGSDNVARNVVECIADENIATRNIAAEVLIGLREQSVAALMPYLYDSNQDVRKFAVDLLGLIRSTEAVAHLIHLLADNDANVVVAAAEALGNVGTREATAPLLELYASERYARVIVAEALGKIADPESVPFLLRSIGEELEGPDGDPLLLYALLEAIGFTDDRRVLMFLRNAAGRVAPSIRPMLLHALVRIAKRRGEGIPDVEGVRGWLLRMLQDETPAIRLSGVRGVAELSGPDVVSALILALNGTDEVDEEIGTLLDRRPETLSLLVELLANGTCRPTLAVVSLLKRELARTRLDALDDRIIAGGAVLVAKASGVLAAAWRGAAEELRASIVDVLFRLDGDRAVAFLDTLMSEPDPWLRMRIIELLGPVHDSRAPEFVTRFLSDDDEMVRKVASASLARRSRESD